jgi:sarcosine oxidase subunit alpha
VSSHRLNSGGLIERDTPLSFTFDGETFAGFAGDTLASALIANGVRLVGRSFKYHRPRGVMTAGSEEPNALDELRTGAAREPNSAPHRRVFGRPRRREADTAGPRSPSTSARSTRLSPFLVAGFYYKTFMCREVLGAMYER